MKDTRNNLLTLVIASGVFLTIQGCSGEPGVLVDGRLVTSTITGSPSCSDTTNGVVQSAFVDVPISFVDSSIYGRFQDPFPTWDVDGDGDVDYTKPSFTHRFSSGGMQMVVFCIDEKREQCMDIWLCVTAMQAPVSNDTDSTSNEESLQSLLDGIAGEVSELDAIASQMNTNDRRLRNRVGEYRKKISSLLKDVQGLISNIYLIQGAEDIRILDVSSRLEKLKEELVSLSEELDAYASKEKEKATKPVAPAAPIARLPPPPPPPPSVCTTTSLVGSSARVGQKVDNSTCECDGGESTRFISESTLKIEPKRCLKLSECRVMVSDNGTVQVRVKGPGGKPNATESFYVNKGCSQLRFDDISQLVLNKDVEYEIEITAAGSGLKIADFSACSEHPSQYMRISGRNNPLGNLIIKY